jgi:Fe-S oxidoreductase
MANAVDVQRKVMSPAMEIAKAVEEAGGEELKKCYQCGTCSAVCPWGNLRPFSPRAFIEMARLGLEGFEAAAWTCVSCKQCWDRCPQQINIPQLFQAVRSILTEWNSRPATMNAPLGCLRAAGNPWGETVEARDAWVRAAEVPAFGPGTEHLLFTCCTNDYDARNRRDSMAVVEVLRDAGVSFGHVGNEERCCGDMAYTAGDNGAYRQLQAENREMFGKNRVASMIVTSPHCLNAFRKRYDWKEGEAPRSLHVTELFEQKIRDGSLKPTRPIAKKVTYHDPCYLGRHNGIYDAPRNVLKAIPGLDLVEMHHTGDRSLCCGGGGGGVWVETAKGERLGDLRIGEALEVGAEVIATGCPFCVQMLESSLMSFNLEEKLKVMTVSELLAESLRPAEG